MSMRYTLRLARTQCGDTSVRTGSSSGTRGGWAGVLVRRLTSPLAVTGTGAAWTVRSPGRGSGRRE